MRRLLAAILLLTACGAADRELVVRDPWVRLPPPGANTAAYMEIFNPGPEPLRILAVSAASVERVELHRSMRSGGMASMQALGSLELPAREAVVLEPGGLHLMLIRPGELREGGHVELDLALDDGRTLSVRAPVRR